MAKWLIPAQRLPLVKKFGHISLAQTLLQEVLFINQNYSNKKVKHRGPTPQSRESEKEALLP